MDIRYPYADPPSRLQLLYRLPTAPHPRRLLLVSGADTGADIGAGWGEGEVVTTDLVGLLKRVAAASPAYDAVALPGTLQPRAAAPRNADVLRAAASLLVPGGALVGHLPHGLALRRLLHPAGLLAGLAAVIEGDAMAGPKACRRALVAAGLQSPECFFVQPRIDDPMALVPSQRAAARHHFLRSARSTWHATRPGVRELRFALAWLGLGGMAQGELFFWARKPC